MGIVGAPDARIPNSLQRLDFPLLYSRSVGKKFEGRWFFQCLGASAFQGDPTRRAGPPARRTTTTKRREGVTLADQYATLLGYVEMITEQRDRAEHEIEYMTALADEVAKRAKLSDDDMAEIRIKVRAEYEVEREAAPGAE